MEILNIEIKARIDQPNKIRQTLANLQADYKGLDHQIDTYFKVNEGRLKLRQGNIENSLIKYDRAETDGLKKSTVTLQKLPKDVDGLKKILEDQLGVFKIVDKKREIYFIENVKFHIDQVEELGTFVEIEAISHGEYTEVQLQKQCQHFIDEFMISDEQFVAKSYSDMI